MGEHAAKKGIDVLICIGDLSAEIARGAKDTALRSAEQDGASAAADMEIHHYASKSDFFKDAGNILMDGDTILVKASHGMEFPEIVDKLAAK